MQRYKKILQLCSDTEENLLGRTFFEVFMPYQSVIGNHAMKISVEKFGNFKENAYLCSVKVYASIRDKR